MSGYLTDLVSQISICILDHTAPSIAVGWKLCYIRQICQKAAYFWQYLE